MKRILITCILLLFINNCLYAQYGNEWIIPSQQYYKLKVTSQGIHRIDHNALVQAGVPVSTIDPIRFQLFFRGTEQAVYIQGENDHSFDNGDFIEFFGQKNDGFLDKELFANPDDQVNPYYSFYSDTSYYYLTWTNSTPGIRMINTQITNPIFTNELFFSKEAVSFFSEEYALGEANSFNSTASEYTKGEGFVSVLINKSTITKTVPTPFLFNNGSQALAEIVVTGRSNAQTSNPNGYNHHIRIEVSPDNNIYTTVADSSYRGYNVIKFQFSLPLSSIGNPETFFRFSSDEIGAVTDYRSIATIKLTYPQSYNISGLQSMFFNFTGINVSGGNILKFYNSNLSSPVLYDFTNNLRLKGQIISDTFKVHVPNAGTVKQLFLNDSNSFTNVSLEKINLNYIDAAIINHSFIIVSNHLLKDAAQEYKNYRQQKYNTLLVTTDDLYDQFSYGQHHPLAIRRFCNYLIENAAVKPQYLLLLGKGQQTNMMRSFSSYQSDLVPSIGIPPSDAMFTSGLDTTDLEPAIATARVAAKNNEDVRNYLDKLTEYENLPDSLWRKTFVHVSGGNTIEENTAWSSYQKAFENQAKEEFFGCKVIGYNKNVNEPITNNLKEKIIININSGISLLSFFGHGANFATEINFGAPNELNNRFKYPVYMLNGCLLGNPNTTSSLGEQFIFEKNRGAIGWIATSDEGYPNYLANFSTRFYNNSFKKNYGKSISENLAITVKEFQNPNDYLNVFHCRQYNFQGDPALHFFAPALPDYELTPKDVFMFPENVTALTDSFAIACIVKNIGKATKDSIRISVKRTYADNSTETYAVKKYEPVYHSDTFYYYIPGVPAKSKGENKFEVSIDPDHLISELDETNNTTELIYYFPSNGLNILFPKKNTIYTKNKLKLVAQSNNLLTGNTSYYFEIDTNNQFNSSWKKSSGIMSAGFMPVWEPSVTLEDNKTYYWRVRQDLPFGEGGDWEESSFIFVSGSEFGYYVGPKQFKDLHFKNIDLDTITGSLSYANSAFGTSIETRGDDAPTNTERVLRTNPGGAVGFIGFEFTGITFVTFNPVDLRIYSQPSAFNHQNEPGIYSGQYVFNPAVAGHLDSLAAYLNNIPDGYYVLGLNGRAINIKSFPESVHQAFESIGCALTRTVDAGWPYLFFAQKGSSPGTALEKTADTINSTVPPRVQHFKVDKEYYSKWLNGEIITNKIGPSNQWKELKTNILAEVNDSVKVQLIGTNAQNIDTVLVSSITQNIYDLSSIDARLFPYLKIKILMSDSLLRTPVRPQSLQILFNDLAEGTLHPEIQNVFYKNTIDQGDSISWKLAYQNISDYITDSLKVSYTITKEDRTEISQTYQTLAPLDVSDTLYVNLKLDTRPLSGTNKLKISVEPLRQQDSYGFNNFLSTGFSVVKDQKKPLVDITFDGKRIINNEIVSAKPHIVITAKDENKYLLLTDTSAISIALKRPGSNTFENISFNSPELRFSPATSSDNNKAQVDFTPELSENGIYSLMIRTKDASGNGRISSDYTIDFEVINESSITNFYPYPNPFTTSMRFVFTLTGSRIPDQLKVQIMTVSGKVVREISRQELGNIRIGNNISEFTWNGTDQFGDRLANGVYFYRVLTKIDGQNIKHRFTEADKYVEKGFGKIYLMK
jgi:hypothetical protein